MKLFPKTSEDFGIPYSGDELKTFNKRFSEYFTKLDNDASPFKRFMLCLLGLAALAACVLIACKNALNIFTAVIMIFLPAIPFFTFVYAFFVKNAALKMRIRNCSAACLCLCIIPVGVAALTEAILFNYLLFAICMVVGLPIGVYSWSRRTIKNMAVSEEKAKAEGKLTFAIGAAAAVAVVPVIRALSDQKDVMYIILVFSTSVLCALIGWVMGLGIENIRYYRFLKKFKA